MYAPLFSDAAMAPSTRSGPRRRGHTLATATKKRAAPTPEAAATSSGRPKTEDTSVPASAWKTIAGDATQ